MNLHLALFIITLLAGTTLNAVENPLIPSGPHDKFFPTTYLPTGMQRTPVDSPCHPFTHETKILNATSFAEQKSLRKDYLARCEQQLGRMAQGGLQSTIDMDGVRYSLKDNPHIRPVQWQLGNGETVYGFLATKPDQEPRPLVIVKCGLYCQGDDTGNTRTLTAHLFDESPFHLLVIGSHSGENNVISNRRISIGGFYEGQEAFLLADYVKTNLKLNITDMHFLGVSLGGNAALFTALYNDYFPKGQQPFRSVVAYCPAVNLEESMIDLFSRAGVVSSTIRSHTQNIINNVYDHVTDLQALIKKGEMPTADKLHILFGEVATNFYRKLDSQNFLAPFDGYRFNHLEDLWWLVNFTNHAYRVRTPTMVVSSQDDPVVFDKSNSIPLQQSLPSDSMIDLLRLKHGGHCGMSRSYGWAMITSLLRSFFLSQSDYKITRHSVSYPHPLPKLEPSEVHVGQEWLVNSASDITLKFYVWSRGTPSCNAGGPFQQSELCYYSKRVSLQWKDLAYLAQPKPNSSADAQRLTRWLNSHIRIFTDNGELLLGHNRSPAQMTILQDAPY